MVGGVAARMRSTMMVQLPFTPVNEQALSLPYSTLEPASWAFAGRTQATSKINTRQSLLMASCPFLRSCKCPGRGRWRRYRIVAQFLARDGDLIMASDQQVTGDREFGQRR